MTLTKNTLVAGFLATILVLLFMSGLSAKAAAPDFDTTGTYEVAFEYLGTDYGHDMTLTQDNLGNLAGNGGSPIGANIYTWVIATGTVSDNAINFTANYTATADAVTPLTVMNVSGTIASNGSMSGIWSDNYNGGVRGGTWESTSGLAIMLGSLAAEDFGVVINDTGSLGIVKGYTAGFGLTDATFEDVQSVVISLYSGATLLQTNTATAQVGIDIVDNQISTPFDVSGTFDYVTDGYWVNVREAEYGQTLPATKVVATVTLANGKVVTAENTVLVGDPATIYPVVVPPTDTDPTNKEACKNGGWKTFTDPTFKNQGQCVSHVEHQNNRHNEDESIEEVDENENDDSDDSDDDDNDESDDDNEVTTQNQHKGDKGRSHRD